MKPELPVEIPAEKTPAVEKTEIQQKSEESPQIPVRFPPKIRFCDEFWAIAHFFSTFFISLAC